MKLNFVRVINKLVKLLGNINVQNTTYFISKHESFSLSHNFICTLYKEETKQSTYLKSQKNKNIPETAE